MHAPVLTLAALCFSQDAAHHDQENPHDAVDGLQTIGHLTECDVRVIPSAEERREGMRNGETVERPVVDLEQFLLNERSGELEWAVISVGGFLGIGERDVLVPYGSLEWNAEEDFFELSSTKEQLEALPAFDVSEAQNVGLDARVRECAMGAGKAGYALPAGYAEREGEAREGASDKSRQGGEQPGRQAVPAGYAAVGDRLLASDRALDAPVHASDEDLGGINELVVDTKSGELAFAIVGSGGILGLGETEFVVPYEYLGLFHDVADEEDDLGEWFLPMTAKTVESLPTYEQPEEGVIGAADWQRVQRRFEELTARAEETRRSDG